MAYNGALGKVKNYNSSELTALFSSKLINNTVRKNLTNCDLYLSVNIKISSVKDKIDICFGVDKIEDITVNVLYPEIQTEGNYIIPICLPSDCYVKIVIVGNCVVDYINVVAMGM